MSSNIEGLRSQAAARDSVCYQVESWIEYEKDAGVLLVIRVACNDRDEAERYQEIFFERLQKPTTKNS